MDIEHYGASFGDDFDAKMNLFKHMKNEMVLMNSWYIEHYGASFGDDIDAKMN